MNRKTNYVKIALLTIILADLVKSTIKKNKVTVSTQSFIDERYSQRSN